jgi:hypothetical protein
VRAITPAQTPGLDKNLQFYLWLSADGALLRYGYGPVVVRVCLRDHYGTIEHTGDNCGDTPRSVGVCQYPELVSALSDFLTEPNFWWGSLAGTLVTGVVAPLLTARSLRASDRRKADQEDRMDTKKAEREDLRSNRQLIRETATAFSEVCSSIFEKAIDAKGIFNAVADAAATMQGGIDKKALDKVEYSMNLIDETKRIATAYNNLRVVAPVPLLQKASALNAAVITLIGVTTNGRVEGQASVVPGVGCRPHNSPRQRAQNGDADRCPQDHRA